MFNYDFEGFQFQFDEKTVLLRSNLLSIKLEQQAKLFEAVRSIQNNLKGLYAAGELGDLLHELTTEMRRSKEFRCTSIGLKTILTKYDTPLGRDQIELWFSYLVQMTPSDLEEDWEVFQLWDRLEEAIAFDARYMEYLQYRRFSERYPTAHHGYVYLFKLSSGHYKIGFSNNPQRRGREITSGLPFTLEIIHQIPSNQITALEAELYKQYAEKRHGTTEWFDLEPDDVTAIQSITERKYPWIDNPEWAEEFKRTTEFFQAGRLGAPR